MLEIDKTEQALRDAEAHINNVGRFCHRFNALKKTNGKLTENNEKFYINFPNNTEIGKYSSTLIFGDYIKNLAHNDYISLIKLIKHGKIKVIETTINDKTTYILRTHIKI